MSRSRSPRTVGIKARKRSLTRATLGDAEEQEW